MKLPSPASALLPALLLAAGESAAAFSPPDRLIVVSDDSYPPYLFRTDSGFLEGIIVDKWALWSRKTGVPVTVEGMEWAKAQESVGKGSADVIDALAYTEARAPLYEFSAPYADVDARVFFRGSIGGISDVASMRGFTIGAKDGSACAAWLAERGVTTLRLFPTSDAVVEAARTREVPLFCMDVPAAQYFIFKDSLAGEFRQTEPLYVARFHWAVAKGRIELRDFIQTGFNRIDTAEMTAIEARWNGSPVRPPFDSRYLYVSAAAASLIAGAILLVAWHRSLAVQAYSDNAEQKALARIFYVIAVAIAVAFGVSIANNVLLSRSGVPIVLPVAGLAVVALILAARRGYLRFARPGLPLVVIATSAYFILTRDGVHDAAVLALAGSLVIGGVLLTRRAMVLVTIAALAVLFGTGTAEIVGALQTRLSGFTDLQYLIGAATSLLVFAIASVVVAESLFAGLRQAEEKSAALSASEQRFGQVFRLSPDGIVVSSVAEGRVIETNDAFLRIVGRARDEVIGRTETELGIWRDAHERMAMLALPAMTPGGGVRQYEHSIRTPAGDKRDVLVRATCIDLQGEPVLLSIVRDITERRRAQLLLEESEQRLARMIEASPEAITIASVDDGTFMMVNPAAERLSGYTREELVGHSSVALGFWPDLHDRERLIDDLLLDEAVHARELRLRRKNGQIRDVLISAALIDFKGSKFVLFQGIDITERKNAEKGLREHQELLRELSAHHESVREEERAHIAREIHDEMGQALTALKMDLSVIGLESAKAAPRTSKEIQELKGRVDDIIQLVRDVATALRPSALDLGIISGIEWLVDEFQKRNGIRCAVEVEDGEIHLAEDRSIVLFRILQESLTNISRHANARNVEIRLRCDGTHVRLDVKDDGRGFDVEAIRERKTFGLLGIRERVIMLHGTLSISSVPGEGTQVSVSIPL
ncbi:MAG TPA: PAS domain S-box protein [Burkholderiales bacterium]|nr:PAS domain S-box protein [Burkholderiales bacterium]